MRIAFLVGTFPNLTETFILNQITGLLDRGHEVDIYAVKKGETSKIHPEIESYNLFKKTYFLSDLKISRNKFIRTMKVFRLIFKGLRKNPKAVLRALNLFKYGKRAFSLELLYKISPFLGKKPYDIVHCHFGHVGNLGVLFKDLGAIKGKMVVTFYGFDVSYYVKNNGRVYRELFDKGDLFIALSDYMKRKLIELGCKEEFIIKHPLGVNPEEFIFRERKPVSKNLLRILSVARFAEKKGLEYSIKAVAEILKFYNVEYIIVGDGPLRDKIKELIKDLKIEDKVEMLGWRNKEELKNIFDTSDIFVLPSVTAESGDEEGTPTVLLEAMSSGMPVISTYHAGIPEQVRDGKSGFLVPERDVDSLAEKIKYLIERPEIWPEMGRSGRKWVEENYDIVKLNDRLVEIYKKLIGEDN